MDRLTYWNEEHGCWSYHCPSGDAATRLALYENTGLTPEEVAALVKAKQEGRVMLYAPGDKVIDYAGEEWTVRSVEKHRFRTSPFMYRLGIDGTGELAFMHEEDITLAQLRCRRTI